MTYLNALGAHWNEYSTCKTLIFTEGVHISSHWLLFQPSSKPKHLF